MKRLLAATSMLGGLALSPHYATAQAADNKAQIERLVIENDGDVGQVWFDYVVLNGSYKKMWGKESWLVVRTVDGWKIAGVVSSQEFNPVPARAD
jgi:hypothetical protein